MKSVMNAMSIAVIAAAFASITAPAVAQDRPRAQPSAFAMQPFSDGGAAVVSNPFGGQYVYRAEEVPDGRRAAIFALGQQRRTEYTLFSAEEEAALWEMKPQRVQSTTTQAARARHPVRRSRSDAGVLLWPKVVLEVARTCVPELPYADAPDWREHLVCWPSEQVSKKLPETRHVQ